MTMRKLTKTQFEALALVEEFPLDRMPQYFGNVEMSYRIGFTEGAKLAKCMSSIDLREMLHRTLEARRNVKEQLSFCYEGKYFYAAEAAFIRANVRGRCHAIGRVLECEEMPSQMPLDEWINHVEKWSERFTNGSEDPPPELQRSVKHV